MAVIFFFYCRCLTSVSRPCTVVYSHQTASDSSPWKVSEHYRWDHGSSWGTRTEHRLVFNYSHTHTHSNTWSVKFNIRTVGVSASVTCSSGSWSFCREQETWWGESWQHCHWSDSWCTHYSSNIMLALPPKQQHHHQYTGSSCSQWEVLVLVLLPGNVGWTHTWPTVWRAALGLWQTLMARWRPESPPARSGTSPLLDCEFLARTLTDPWSPVNGEDKSSECIVNQTPRPKLCCRFYKNSLALSNCCPFPGTGPHSTLAANTSANVRLRMTSLVTSQHRAWPLTWGW